MIARRLGAAVLILGAGGLTGCILVNSNTGGSGGTISTTSTTTTATTATVTGATGDTTTTGDTGPGTTTGNTGPATTSTGGGCGGIAAADCSSACHAIYQCGQMTCGGASQLCVGFKAPLTENVFVSGNASNGCLENCQILSAGDQAAFIAKVDPNDCSATIANFTAINSCDANTCNNGTCN